MPTHCRLFLPMLPLLLVAACATTSPYKQLEAALKRGDVDEALALERNRSPSQLLCISTMMELVPATQTLLARGVSPNGTCAGGARDTPLGWAAMGANPTLVQMLLQQGANPDAALGTGKAPIHLAASCGTERTNDCIRVITLLLDKGVSVNARASSPNSEYPDLNYRDWTPRDFASYSGQRAIGSFLSGRGGTHGVSVGAINAQLARDKAAALRDASDWEDSKAEEGARNRRMAAELQQLQQQNAQRPAASSAPSSPSAAAGNRAASGQNCAQIHDACNSDYERDQLPAKEILRAAVACERPLLGVGRELGTGPCKFIYHPQCMSFLQRCEPIAQAARAKYDACLARAAQCVGSPSIR